MINGFSSEVIDTDRKAVIALIFHNISGQGDYRKIDMYVVSPNKFHGIDTVQITDMCKSIITT